MSEVKQKQDAEKKDEPCTAHGAQPDDYGYYNVSTMIVDGVMMHSVMYTPTTEGKACIRVVVPLERGGYVTRVEYTHGTSASTTTYHDFVLSKPGTTVSDLSSSHAPAERILRFVAVTPTLATAKIEVTLVPGLYWTLSYYYMKDPIRKDGVAHQAPIRYGFGALDDTMITRTSAAVSVWFPQPDEGTST